MFSAVKQSWKVTSGAVLTEFERRKPFSLLSSYPYHRVHFRPKEATHG
jgi:hypothetical protein